MTNIKKYFLFFLYAIIILNPSLSFAYGLGNGGDLAGDNLERLTADASVKVLNATAKMFTMISYLEKSGNDKIAYVKRSVPAILADLNSAKDILSEGMGLPNSEFRKMDSWLKRVNFSRYPEIYEFIRKEVWNEVVTSTRNGGRNWLEYNIKFIRNLHEIANNFGSMYMANPSTQYIWSLISRWNKELDRGVYLSIIVSEQKF